MARASFSFMDSARILLTWQLCLVPLARAISPDRARSARPWPGLGRCRRRVPAHHDRLAR
ncbi:MAG: hypothetical protein WDN06_16440 [Asticcacaulis sp.]